MSEPNPTTRAVIDPLRRCNLRCSFCYYLHTDMEMVAPWEDVKASIDRAKARGNDYIDVTGGEPMLYPVINELILYARTVCGMGVCIITNGIANTGKYDSAIDMGVDDWLISMHGVEEVHDMLVNRKDARAKQRELIHIIADRQKTYRVNHVITAQNYGTLPLFVGELLKLELRPRIVNFINFNPHHEWKTSTESNQFVANLKCVQSMLEPAIEQLEAEEIGVNVRYYPMCRMKPKLRRTICNDLHVGFDPYEWDYDLQPKTFECFMEWAQLNSQKTEHKERPCSVCDLFMICGGINAAYNEFTEGKCIEAVTDFDGDKGDFYYYRRGNTVTLEPRKGGAS